jgi:hypothetical protein
MIENPLFKPFLTSPVPAGRIVPRRYALSHVNAMSHLRKLRESAAPLSLAGGATRAIVRGILSESEEASRGFPQIPTDDH